MYSSPQAILKGMLNPCEEQPMSVYLSHFVFAAFTPFCVIFEHRLNQNLAASQGPQPNLAAPIASTGLDLIPQFELSLDTISLTVCPSSVTCYMDLQSPQFPSKNVVLSFIYLFILLSLNT